MKGNPVVAGGSLTSKPTWLNTCGCLATSVFLRAWWHARGRNAQGVGQAKQAARAVVDETKQALIKAFE